MSVEIKCNKCESYLNTDSMIYCMSCVGKLKDIIIDLERENAKLREQKKERDEK